MNHYEEFGVPPSASTEEIRQAHRRLARLFHPDRIQQEELRSLAENQMKRLNAICAVLCDPRRRLQYDLSLARGEGGYAPARTKLRSVSWRSVVGFAAAAVCMAGIAWLYQTRPAAGPAVADPDSLFESTSAKAPTLPAEPAPDQARPTPAPAMPNRAEALERRNAELERAIESVVSERDIIVADLARLREELELARGPSLPSLVDPPPAAAPPAVQDVRDPPPAPTRDVAGTWFYVPSRDAPATEHTYPPEYIEAVITTNGGQVWGRYRGRYVVTDRAISPEVVFQFHGKHNDEGRYPWTGRAGAAGEVHLELLSGDSLRVEWLASDLGQQMGLASGSALLTRRRDP